MAQARTASLAPAQQAVSGTLCMLLAHDGLTPLSAQSCNRRQASLLVAYQWSARVPPTLLVVWSEDAWSAAGQHLPSEHADTASHCLTLSHMGSRHARLHSAHSPLTCGRGTQQVMRRSRSHLHCRARVHSRSARTPRRRMWRSGFGSVAACMPSAGMDSGRAGPWTGDAQCRHQPYTGPSLACARPGAHTAYSASPASSSSVRTPSPSLSSSHSATPSPSPPPSSSSTAKPTARRAPLKLWPSCCPAP